MTISSHKYIKMIPVLSYNSSSSLTLKFSGLSLHFAHSMHFSDIFGDDVSFEVWKIRWLYRITVSQSLEFLRYAG